MADDITSWLSRAIVQHDEEHGGNFKIPLKGKYVQMIKFSSYRDRFDPCAEIKGTISDRTHWIRVRFDVEATNDFEEPTASLPAESLTSNLRSIFLLESFRINLSPPSSSVKKKTPQSSNIVELPEVVLEILKWKVVGGSRNDPEFYENTVEIGKGKNDGDVQRLLRKWWFGESNSSQSFPSSQFETPSRLLPQNDIKIKQLASSPLTSYHSAPGRIPVNSSSSGPEPHAKSSDRTTLLDFLQPYINGPKGKKKIIPEWLFEKSDETKEMLNDIEMFGLQLEVSPQENVGASLSQHIDESTSGLPGSPDSGAALRSPQPPSETIHSRDKGKGKEITPCLDNTIQSIIHSPERPRSSVGLSSHSPSPRKSKQQPVSSVQNQVTIYHREGGDAEEDSEDDDIPIRPRPVPAKKKRRDVFDPMAMLSSSPAQEEMQVDTDQDEAEEERVSRNEPVQNDQRNRFNEGDEDEDEDELSDYEREQRRKSISKGHTNLQGGISNATSNKEIFEEKNEDEEIEETDRAVPASRSYILENANKTMENSQNSVNSNFSQEDRFNKRKEVILVDDSDQSLPQQSTISSNRSSTQTQSQNQVEHIEHVKIENPAQSQIPKRPFEVLGPSQTSMKNSSAITHISPSHPSSSNRPQSNQNKRVKIEYSTPEHTSTPTPSPQSAGKGTRKSFLDSIRIFKSSSLPRPNAIKTDEEEVDSPLVTKRKKGEEEGILERFTKWAKGNSAERVQSYARGAHMDDPEPMTGMSRNFVGSERLEEEAENVEIHEEVGGDHVKAEVQGMTQDPHQENLEDEIGKNNENSSEDSDGSQLLQSLEQEEISASDHGYQDQVKFEEAPDHLSHPSQSPSASIQSPSDTKSASQSPILRAKKLGGFKLNLQVNGLSQYEVKKAVDNINKIRSRKLGK
ncbi:uncharacterized protein IL334_006594 [Kwoniella shivajii]|uniref:Telomere replication protein EST3 n=1 Tax=Kwoniella shivajii TaxID=564305 RepID=A0ABZ1D8A9_9TREE|nr:hypothetical protein IL334_006594 [Kwoniella shivajii]